MRVAKPRLRKKRRRADESGEVEVPAYTALQADQRLADRMLELVLNGVSTRRYEQVLPAMADQVGISKSEISRETIEAGTRVLQELAERDLSELDVLVVYLDGIVFGDYHVLAAVGVDATGRKHVVWRQVLLPLNVNYSCRFRTAARSTTHRSVGVAAGSEDAEDQTA